MKFSYIYLRTCDATIQSKREQDRYIIRMDGSNGLVMDAATYHPWNRWTLKEEEQLSATRLPLFGLPCEKLKRRVWLDFPKSVVAAVGARPPLPRKLLMEVRQFITIPREVLIKQYFESIERWIIIHGWWKIIYSTCQSLRSWTTELSKYNVSSVSASLSLLIIIINRWRRRQGNGFDDQDIFNFCYPISNL